MNNQFDALPSALRRQARCERVGDVPVLLVEPEGEVDQPPLLVWLHGRTARKELDPGRYLRLMRNGIAACAMDLPGHGERFDASMQTPDAVVDTMLAAAAELDDVATAAVERLGADPQRVAIGGMSAGGMASLSRLCQPHPYAAAAVEAASGSWEALPLARHAGPSQRRALDRFNPIRRLAEWRAIPLLAVHARHDQWVPQAPQWAFLDLVQGRGDPSLIERVLYDHTGAAGEHAGFGIHAADAKAAQLSFLQRRLGATTPGATGP
ncbi:MAG: alpha/beta fold hydrolase [Phycisphaerales bacterium]|jgi:poly(3-hydroxybutyrate) depolymerase|nr:alpha/beta fold hydrolase [Phycisphaerales bacterium]